MDLIAAMQKNKLTNPPTAANTKPVASTNSSTLLPTAAASSSSSLFKLIESNSINKTADFNQIVINTSKPIEIYHGYGELSARQTKILEQLPKYESSIYLHKNDVNVVDLAALTAKTGDEFALFTLGARRMIVRGDSRGIDIADILPKLQAEKWTWSAHTHPGTRDIALNASGIPGDRQILELLGQNRSLIVNSAGRRNVFDTENDMHITNKTVNTKLRNKND